MEPVVPELKLEAVRFHVYRGERLAAHGWAERVRYRRDTGDLAGDDVVALFPAEFGAAETRLEARRASGNSRARDLLAQGGVRLVQGGEVATTDEARYDPEDGLVHGDRPVVIRGRGYALAGPGFVLDPRASTLTVQGGARLDAGGCPTP